MRKVLLFSAALAAILIFSTSLFAGDPSAKEKMISGKISKVECDKSRITITDVKELASKKRIPGPDVVLTMTKATKFTGVKECKDITAGTFVYASYLVKDNDNMATHMILKTMMDKGPNRGGDEKGK